MANGDWGRDAVYRRLGRDGTGDGGLLGFDSVARSHQGCVWFGNEVEWNVMVP